MTISTYSELQTAVASWLHRSDLTATIPDFIKIAEARFNRRLRTKQQETALSSTAINASYQVAIPANTVAVKKMWRTGTPVTPLLVGTLLQIVERQTGGTTDALAYRYAWEGSYWRYDGTGTVAGVLYRNIPDLATNSTNWLLTSYPDVYLYASLYEAMVYLRDPDGIQFFESRAAAALETVQLEQSRDEFSGGPLTIKAG
jgi:hypothetical protein